MLQHAGHMSTVSLVITVCLGMLLLLLPRRYALVPLLVSGCYMTLGQALIISDYHFFMIRILIAFGFARLLIRRELAAVKFNIIDKIFSAWLLVSSLLFLLLSGETALLNERLGSLYNGFGIYCLARALIQDFNDIVHITKMLALITIPLIVPFLVEYLTGLNPFFVLGGVPEYTQIREGKLRCQGPFAHPILAGTFAATSVPLFVGLYSYSRPYRLIALAAIFAATFIVIASSSSGPMLAYIGIIVGLFCWRYRGQMRSIRWGIGLSLLALHMIMKAPVWFLISRISDLTGGSGWYRSALIDAFIGHFSEWWLFGTSYTVHWMPTGIAINPRMTDIVNHYVAQGVNGGLAALFLFIWLLVECFRSIGRAQRWKSRYSENEQYMIWALGVGIVGHMLSFFSVSYFDQINIFWYLTIVMAAGLVRNTARGARGQAA